ncbi:MAG TPA: protein-L-isoaspartate O-methyltransferase [Porphyromonadaceae bacterium]|nr:protein-L-isoaspartate O-methyltransferase [Porphyromonadaceae bacterium]
MRTRRREILLLFFVTLYCALTVTCTSQTVNKQKEKKDTPMADSSQNKNEKAEKLAKDLKRKGIRDERVLAAIAKIPRDQFVDESLAEFAYLDRPLPIEAGQTISQPYTVAFQTELLQLKPGEKVLEIGTGSGYQAAVLCEMGAEVYSIERYQELYLLAKERLHRLGYTPQLFFGDGYEGLPDHAPFDKILVTAAPEEIPEKLKAQLRIGGWMVIPLGGRQGQKMTVVKRMGENRYRQTTHGDFIFVPMQKGTKE